MKTNSNMSDISDRLSKKKTFCHAFYYLHRHNMAKPSAMKQWFQPFIIQFPVELCFTYSGHGAETAIWEK